MRDFLKFLYLFFALLLFPCAAIGATATVIPATRLIKPPVIDGNIDPAEWAGATRGGPLIEPLTGKPAEDQTETWIAYTDQAIYVAFYAHDSKPTEIVGREITHGADFNGEDVVSFKVNPFGTRRDNGTSEFMVNCLNTQVEHIAGGRTSKREWRGLWDSAVKRVADGWTIEMRIPWAMLNYQGGKSVPMDILFERYQARTHVHSQFPNLTLNEKWEYTAIWDGVQPPTNSAKPKVEFLAYTAPEYNDRQFTLRSGLDARYAFTKDLTGLVSLNPDFKNIESEIAGIEFTRTERRLGEARPFFNEGGDFFHLTGGFGYGQMFYSRRIESFDYGAKAFGHLDRQTSIAALTTVNTGKEEAGVVRIFREESPYLSYSAFGTFLNRKGDVSDQAFGFDMGANRGVWSAGASASGDKGFSRRLETAGTSSISYSVPHFFATIRGEWIEPDFNPPLAYISWTNRKGAYLYSEHFEEYKTGFMRKFDANIYATNFNQYDGSLQQRGLDTNLNWTTRHDMRIGVSQSQTRYADGLDSVFGVGLNFNVSNRYRQLGFYSESGKRSGKGTRYTSINGNVRTFKKLDLGLEYAILRSDGTDTRLVGTMGYEISPTQSISARYAALSSLTNLYVAYRNAGSTGTELFVIVGDPNADGRRGSLHVQNRVSVKLAWVF